MTMFRMGEMLYDAGLESGDPGGERAEKLVCGHFNNLLTQSLYALTMFRMGEVLGGGGRGSWRRGGGAVCPVATLIIS
jgi:hypothetical protein